MTHQGDHSKLSVQLVQSQNIPWDIQYLTLSHCWGEALLQVRKGAPLSSPSASQPPHQPLLGRQTVSLFCMRLAILGRALPRNTQSVVAFRDSLPSHSMSRAAASLSAYPWVPVSGQMQNVDLKRGIYIYTFIHWWIKGGPALPHPIACWMPQMTRRPQGA